MRELGPHSDALHAGLAPAVLDAHVDELILIGDEMRPLAEQVVGKLSLDLVANVEEATDALAARLHPGDADGLEVGHRGAPYGAPPDRNLTAQPPP